ncbi:CD209 antigen-like protein E [Fundulus heteroclitus]|uniref:CD209 antigen-like protein E n=1 Tax=Fundulus heteroclitus TaxID=8078 RepID=UPI00165AF944|nr:CD209 antigen-like protein E [Fundulus heteroclitus]
MDINCDPAYTMCQMILCTMDFQTLSSEAAASQHENPSRTSKLPSEKVVQLVLGSLLAAALIVIYRLSFDKIRTNQTVKTLKEENEALRRNLSATASTKPLLAKCPPPPEVKNETCLKCEAGWELHGGNCYKFSTRKSSWNESRDSCKDLGGDLVKIDSREEQMFLFGRLSNIMEEAEDKFWIGLTDSEEEGSWLWVDGSPLKSSWSFWSDNQPDNKSKDAPAAEADCVRMGKKVGAGILKSWFDTSCKYPQKSICEKAAETGQCSCVYG